jgi:hypothetical protein
LPKLTKTQKKRLVNDILAKTQKLYLYGTVDPAQGKFGLVDRADMDAISRICKKLLKRIG